jgi:hypothetical protein
MDASTNTGTQQEETRVFVSYAREDAKWVDKNYPHNLIPYLAESLRRHNVTFWFDKELKGGDVFEQHIANQIDDSHIALLIVSQCFLNSEFIENKEMPRIAERAKQGKMIVVPVLVEPCDWNDYPFLADRQMVPGPAPLIEYTESEAQWAKVKFQILDGLKIQVKRMISGQSTNLVELEAPNETQPVQLSASAVNEMLVWPAKTASPAFELVLPVEVLRKAAAQGSAKAQCLLGLRYELGRNAIKDKAKAVQWYRKAAGQGFAIAQYNLGSCYEYGEGVAKNKATAVRWYRKAAEQGDADARKRLKTMGLL